MTKIETTSAAEALDKAYVKDTQQHIDLVRLFMSRVTAELVERAECHDASKFDEPERSIFAANTAGRDAAPYGSPEYIAHLTTVAPALMHHYENNRHHPEHHDGRIDGMNLLDIIEMLCDWMAASMKSPDGDSGAVTKSIRINQKRFGYTDEFVVILENTVAALLTDQSQKGEDSA